MAVNNYAPAEYGGYVSGADSGGGGGGGGSLARHIITWDGDSCVADCSWNDLLEDLEENKTPYFVCESEGLYYGTLFNMQRIDDEYSIRIGYLMGESFPLTAFDPDDPLEFFD